MEKILEIIVRYDVIVQDFIQSHCKPAWLYSIMDFFAQKESILVAVAIFVPFLAWKNWKKALIMLALAGMSVGVANGVADVFKREIKRYRPLHVELSEEKKKSVNPRSFPSSHAANITAAVLVIWFAYPRMGIPVFVTAFFVCAGRLYLNKHYPTDVLVGCLLGAMSSITVLGVLRFASIRIALVREIRKIAFPCAEPVGPDLKRS